MFPAEPLVLWLLACYFSQGINNSVRLCHLKLILCQLAGWMAGWGKAPATKPDVLGSIPKTHMVEGNLTPIDCSRPTHTLWHAPTINTYKISIINVLDGVVHAFNPSAEEAKAGRSI